MPYANYLSEAAAFLAFLKDQCHGRRADDDITLNAIMAGFKAKAPLAARLGLGDDLRARVYVEAPELATGSPDYLLLRAFLANYGPGMSYDYAEEAIMTGKVKDKHGRDVRLAKWLKTEGLGDDTLREFCNARYIGYPGPLADLVALIRDKVVNSRAEVMITANPLDILLSSEFCGFTSCHGLDGDCHENGGFAYIQDGFTAMVAVMGPSQPDYPFKKLGRAMLYVDPTGELRYVIARGYGTLSEAEAVIKRISEEVGRMLATVAGVPVDFKGRADVTYPSGRVSGAGCIPWEGSRGDHENFPVYFDNKVSRVTWHKSLGDTLEAVGLPSFNFAQSTCLQCGDDTDCSSGLACSDCGGEGGSGRYSCAECGDHADPDDGYRNADGELICSDCSDNYFCCEDCSDTLHCDDACTVHGPRWERTVCSDCRDRHYTECADCGEYHVPERTHEVAGHGEICQSCLENGEYYACENCGDLITADDAHYVDDKGSFCADCYGDLFVECADCGEPCGKDEATTVDGDQVCPACLEAVPTCQDCGKRSKTAAPVTVPQLDIFGNEGQDIGLCDTCAAVPVAG